MNTRNSNDENWYLNTLYSAVQVFVGLVVIGLIFGGVFFKQCSTPQPNLRVPYNPTYTKPDTICPDWSKDSTMTDGKIETLNEILAR